MSVPADWANDELVPSVRSPLEHLVAATLPPRGRADGYDVDSQSGQLRKLPPILRNDERLRDHKCSHVPSNPQIGTILIYRSPPKNGSIFICRAPPGRQLRSPMPSSPTRTPRRAPGPEGGVWC